MKKQDNKIQIRLISPKADEALKKLIDKGYIELVAQRVNPKPIVQKPVENKPKVPLNFAKSSNEEILKRLNLKSHMSSSLNEARNIINTTRGNKPGNNE